MYRLHKHAYLAEVAAGAVSALQDSLELLQCVGADPDGLLPDKPIYVLLAGGNGEAAVIPVKIDGGRRHPAVWADGRLETLVKHDVAPGVATHRLLRRSCRRVQIRLHLLPGFGRKTFTCEDVHDTRTPRRTRRIGTEEYTCNSWFC